MNNKALAIVAGLTLLAVLSALWLFRWEKLHGTAAGVYLLDRWTGSVEYVSPMRRFRIVAPPKSAEQFLDE